MTLRRLANTLSRDQQWLFVAFLLWGLSYGAWVNLQPLYLAHLGARPEQIGLALSVGGFVVVSLYVPAGYLTDHASQKHILLGGFALATLATFLIGLAPDWRWTIPGFILYLLASLSRMAETSYITAADRGENLSRSFALLSVGYGIGSLVSPALGGWVAAQWGFRAVLLLAGGFGVLSTLAVAQVRRLPPAVPVRTANGQGLAIRQLLADRGFVWQLAVLLVVLFGLDLGLILAPNYLEQVKGLSLRQIGQLGTVGALGSFLFLALLGPLRAERRRALLLDELAVLIALALLLAAPAGPGGLLPPAFVLAAFLGGAGKATWPVTRGRFSLWLPRQVRSLGLGFLEAISQLAVTLSPFVAGQLYARDPALPLQTALLLAGVSGVLTLTLPRLQLGPRPEAALQSEAQPGD